MVALLRLGDLSDDVCSPLPGDPGYPEKMFRLRHPGRVDVTEARRGLSEAAVVEYRRDRTRRDVIFSFAFADTAGISAVDEVFGLGEVSLP